MIKDYQFCPGAQRFRQPQPEIIKCPDCKEEVEIWTDEVQTTCPNCKRIVMPKKSLNCLDWCRFARECVGDEVYNKYIDNKVVTIKQKLIEEMERYFGEDKKRINHAKSVMHFAEKLLKIEGGDWHIVIPASLLHDIGIKEAERKYGSSVAHYQEREGPHVARGILLKLGFKKEEIDEICEIIAHHHSPGQIDTQNFKLLYDADWLVNLKDGGGLSEKDKLKEMIDRIFLTETGKELAEKTYFKGGS